MNLLERVVWRTFTSRKSYSWADISPHRGANGYPPPDQCYAELAAGEVTGYRLEVGGIVEHPVSLSLGSGPSPRS